MDNSENPNRISRTHWSLWIVGLIAVIWHGMGCMNLGMQLNPEMLAKMPDSHRAIAEGRPIWATLAFALSAVCGVIGGILLLLKKKLSHTFFILSLLGAIIATVHGVVMGNALQLFSPVEIAFAVFGPVIFGLFLVWFTRGSGKRFRLL